MKCRMNLMYRLIKNIFEMRLVFKKFSRRQKLEIFKSSSFKSKGMKGMEITPR